VSGKNGLPGTRNVRVALDHQYMVGEIFRCDRKRYYGTTCEWLDEDAGALQAAFQTL
jgi:hypothetical protein